MLDKMFWSIFEKTGNIDAYMLYKDVRNLNEVETKEEFKPEKSGETANIS